MKATFNVRKNTDGTLTIKVGRKIEHFTIEGKSRAELYDLIRYAAIGAGVFLTKDGIEDILYKVYP
jgi:hypothetical protein